jgi:hypothetical protein
MGIIGGTHSNQRNLLAKGAAQGRVIVATIDASRALLFHDSVNTWLCSLVSLEAIRARFLRSSPHSTNFEI